MIILKYHVKILRYVRRHHFVQISELYQKFGHDAVFNLIDSGYLECRNDPRDIDPFDPKTKEFPESALISLTDPGHLEVESHDWFDLEFFARSFLLPVAVSIATTLITLFLKGVL